MIYLYNVMLSERRCLQYAILDAELSVGSVSACCN